MKIITRILLLMAVLTVSAVAQRKQVAPKIALKYDEFALDARVNAEQDSRFKNFAKIVKTQPNTKAVVIRYFPRVQASQQREPEFELQIIQHQLETLTIPARRIVTINGGIRDRDEIEFWIVPSGALIPDSRPTYAASEVVTCPNYFRIGLYPYFILSRKPPVVFGADFYPAAPANVHYLWSVSDGEIIEGQGSPNVTLDVNRSKNTVVAVKVQVEGLPVECSNQASASMHILGTEPFLFERAVQYNYSNLAAIVDALLIGISESPNAKGYVIAYGSRKEGGMGVRKALASVKRYVAFRKIDSTRLVLLNGGYRSESTVDLWVVPEGSQPPPLSPGIR